MRDARSGPRVPVGVKAAVLWEETGDLLGALLEGRRCQAVEGCGIKEGGQLFLSQGQHVVDGTLLVAGTGVGLNQATIETQRSVERLNHPEQADFLGGDRQRDASAGTAMGSDQTSQRKLGDDLSKEWTRDTLARGDIVGGCSLIGRQTREVKDDSDAIVGASADLH
jgi:hypothetical protein